MLDDRSYMREPSYQEGLSGTVKLMILLGVAFLLQNIDQVYLHSPVLPKLVLRASDVLHGQVWRLFTYQFLHAGILHIAFNLLALFFFGRTVEGVFGSRGLYAFFLLSGAAGGLMHVLAGSFMGAWSGPVVGASAGTMGLLAAYCLLEPDGTILVYFIPVKARYALIGSVGVSLFFTLVPGDSHIAHTAHLGGLLAGMGFMRYGLPGGSWLGDLNLPRLFARRAQAEEERSVPRSQPASAEDFISREVDPILEKISAHGIHSLTPEERKILEDAQKRMSRS